MIRKREIWWRSLFLTARWWLRDGERWGLKSRKRRRRFRFSFFPSRLLHHIHDAPLRWPVLLSLDTRTLSSSCAADEWQTARGSPRLFSLRPLTKRPRSSLVSLLGDRSGLLTITSCSFFLVSSSSCSSPLFFFFFFVVWRILSYDRSRWIGFRSKGLKRFMCFLK